MKKKKKKNDAETSGCEDPNCPICSRGIPGLLMALSEIEILGDLFGGSGGMPGGTGIGMPGGIGIPRELLDMLSPGRMPDDIGMPDDIVRKLLETLSSGRMPIAAIPGPRGITVISFDMHKRGPDGCDCNGECANCQKDDWAKKDCPAIGISFKDGETPIAIFRPQNHRKVDELLKLLKEKETITNDIAIWERILKEDTSASDELSNAGKKWLQNIASKTIKEVRNDDGVGADMIYNNINTIEDFVALFHENPYENELLKDSLEHIRKMAVEGRALEIDKHIETVKSVLPKEHRDATEPLKVQIPMDILEKFAMNYAAEQAATE